MLAIDNDHLVMKDAEIPVEADLSTSTHQSRDILHPKVGSSE